jgi:hypothetical protein
MEWFKLHHEIADDIKIRRFSPQEKWAWIVLLCLANKSSERGIIFADDDDIADYCEFNTKQDWLYYRDKLIAKGMLEKSVSGNLLILNWEKRQSRKPSDDPQRVKERVAKSRANKKTQSTSEFQEDVTRCIALQSPCIAYVTPQTRLDEIRSEEIRSEEIHTNINLRESENDFCEFSGFEDKKKESLENSSPEEKKEPDAVANNPETQETPPPTPAPLRRAKISDIEKFEQKWQAENNLVDCKKLSRNPDFKKFVLGRLQKLPSAKKGDWNPDIADAGKYIAAGQFDFRRRGEIELIHEAFTEYQRSQLEVTQPTASSDRQPMPERSAVPANLKNLIKK